MNTREAIKLGLDTGEFVSLGYLEDLTDAEFLRRPHPACNHINWQVGHLIASEHMMIEKVSPGSMPGFPAGFAEKYVKETATSDDASKFATKSELIATYKAQRAGTQAALAKVADGDFDKPTGVDYAATVAAMYSLQGSHWLMHAGQWAVVRRQLAGRRCSKVEFGRSRDRCQKPTHQLRQPGPGTACCS